MSLRTVVGVLAIVFGLWLWSELDTIYTAIAQALGHLW